MTSPSDMRESSKPRTYDRASSVVFLKTKEAFGGLSNMAGGFPLKVNGIHILTSEALYQACRFPHRPEVQRLIIQQASPMTAKMKSKPYRHDSRLDWNRVRVKIMRWCLHVKLAQNWDSFSELLIETGGCPIVEQSRKDDFWGAKPVDEQTLVGMNVLGRLLMEMREDVKAEKQKSLLCVDPLDIPDFLLDGRPIETVIANNFERSPSTTPEAKRIVQADGGTRKPLQLSLFKAQGTLLFINLINITN
ncbi:MAG: NADAR family protein [Desulfatirhabdiaceae bacterium]